MPARNDPEYNRRKMRYFKRRFRIAADRVPKNLRVRVKWQCERCGLRNDSKIPYFDFDDGFVAAKCADCGEVEYMAVTNDMLNMGEDAPGAPGGDECSSV